MLEVHVHSGNRVRLGYYVCSEHLTVSYHEYKEMEKDKADSLKTKTCLHCVTNGKNIVWRLK